MTKNGGRFNFDDGGSYAGGWLDGKAHGFGVCTGPKGQGEYAGAWVRGFEESGVYTWPSGNTFSGEWQDGKRHGVGVEIKGHWVYRGEWSQGYKGRYGIRQSTISCARYEGTWTTSFQDGYGVETYVDEGTYQGQWQRGMRHGFGVRQSAQFGIAAQYRGKDHLHASLPSAINSHGSPTARDSQQQQQQERGRSDNSGASVTDRHRGGFVLTGRSTPGSGFSDAEQMRSRSSSFGRSLADRFRLRRGQSTGDLPRTVQQTSGHTADDGHGGSRTALGGSGDTGHDLLGANVDIADADVTETYMGEWKADKRSGFGISERSDGLKYVGEWYNDKKHGYGVTTLKDGTKEEGKYKDNELITSGKKRRIFAISKTRLRDRVDAAVVSASRAAEVAQQKAVIATARRANARLRAENSDKAAMKALANAALASEEANKYMDQTPQTSIVPVSQEMRVRMLPDQEESSNQQQQQHQRHPQQQISGQHGQMGEAETVAVKPSRLLPPRQESSDSYTSNQSSSVGSSSVPTSPPPPKPPRSPATVDGPAQGSADADLQYGSRGPPRKPQTAPSRPEPSLITQTAVPLFATAQANVPRIDKYHLTNHVRPSLDDRRNTTTPDPHANSGAGRTNWGGAANSSNRRSNSVRNFRSSAQIETGASYDFSDSADDSVNRVLLTSSRTPHERGQTSPQIVLHPPTPIGRHGAQRVNPDERARQRFPSADEPPATRSQAASTESRGTFSPVLSDRHYQQPISQVLTPNLDTSRGRDFVVAHHHQLSNNLDSASTAQQSDGFPRHQTQLPSYSNERIPTPQINLSNTRSPPNDAVSAKTRSTHTTRDARGRSGIRSGTSSPNAWDGMSLRRRETLPNIVHYAPPNPTGSSSRSGNDGGDPRRSSRETFIIENGVRRRLVTNPSAWETPATEREPPLLLQRFTLEPSVRTGGLEKRSIKSSLPDVHKVRGTTTSIPREQAFALSQQRRDELRREREERERETVVIRLADIKTWCKENQLIMLLVALNLSLAAMFLSFLTHSKDSTK